MKNTTIVQKNRSLKLAEYLSDSKHKSYFVAAVTVVFFIVFLTFGVVPAFSSVLQQNEENGKIQIAIEKSTKKINDLKKMVGESETKSNLISYLEYLFPDSTAQEAFLNDIYEMANRNSVFVSVVAFPDTKRSAPLVRDFGVTPQIASVAVNLNTEGSRDGVLQFVEELENSRRIMNITNIVISRKSGEALIQAGLEREYTLSLNIEYFYWSDTVIN
jgi:cell division protein FtsL